MQTLKQKKKDWGLTPGVFHQFLEWLDEGVYLTGWAEVLFDGHWVPPVLDR